MQDIVPSPAQRPQVSHGLNLTLELKDPVAMPALLQRIQDNMERIRGALTGLHYVHFARFLPVRGNGALLVLTEFDGPVRSYVLDFAIEIGDIFDFILEQVRDHPPLPIREFPAEFIDFVERNNRVVVQAPWAVWEDYPVFSAYPDQTVIEIVGPRKVPLVVKPDDPAPPVPVCEDVQGNILRGIGATRARHYALRIKDPASMRGFLDEVLDGTADKLPRVTFDIDRDCKCRLTIGVTAEGLRAMEVPREWLDTFPAAFLEGPGHPRRAVANGDVGPAAPEFWELGAPGDAVHFLVSLYGDDANDENKAAFENASKQLEAWWNNDIVLVASFKTEKLPQGRDHFGYIDGMAQPRIAGVHDPDEKPDMQPMVRVGEFLLGAGYRNVYGGSSLGRMPAALCENATFAAVRIMEQDVKAFEDMLKGAASATGLTEEDIAAKLMGRRRASGAPESDRGLPPEKINQFDYAPTSINEKTPDDFDGTLCPVGAHMRRMNPRSSLVRGVPYSRRLIRRGMPYGTGFARTAEGALDPDKAPPNGRRGLFGMFICADLERQYEFILQQWGNGDTAAYGIRGTQDPFIAAQDLTGKFNLPNNGRVEQIDVPKMVWMRGSVYLLLPGRQGLKTLATVPAVPKQRGDAPAFDPRTFDPRDPRFIADPYPFYAKFRRTAPVALVASGAYKSYWVFSYNLVKRVCEAEQLFLKQPVSRTPPAEPDRGLFFMDNPRHKEVRDRLDPHVRAFAGDLLTKPLDAALEAALALFPAQADAFDLVAGYSHRVARDVFMQIFGIPENERTRFDALITTLLVHSDRMLPPEHRIPAGAATRKLKEILAPEKLPCRSETGPAEPLLCRFARDGGMNPKELVETLLNFGLGGYLSTDFLVASAVHNLVQFDAVDAYRSLDPGQREKAFEELKRFDPPLPMADRYAADDTELGGCRIPAGAQVTVVYASANHDEQKFEDADRLVLDREIAPDANFMFGHGDHRCIGEPIASRVAPETVNRLLDSKMDLRGSPRDAVRYQNPYFRGLSRLPVSIMRR